MKAENFEFNYIEHLNLPKLGWGAVLKKTSRQVDVHVGSQVETKRDFFVAGVWDGNFEEGAFDEAEFFCGTGAKIVRGGVKLVSPSHERERILFLKKDEKIFASNSIPILLALSGEHLDNWCDQYESIFCSIIDGLKGYQKVIPLANGIQACQIFCADILVDLNFELKIETRSPHRDFLSYDDYYTSLVHVCQAIRDNGSDARRKQSYGLVTTVSSGYDSSAASAIAHAIGCETACTFFGGRYDEDSGVEVAKQLGYKNIVRRSGTEYKTKSAFADARAVSAGDLGSDLQFSAFDDVFKNNIVFCGTCGDTAYGKETIANPDLRRYGIPFFQSNMGHIENALANGYIVLPMPLYALTAHVSIQKITNSEEMEPWTLHNDYDRPIPRRICETYGVRRDAFGVKKHGGGISMSRNFTKKQLRTKMTKAGYTEFLKWLSEKDNNPWTIGRVIRNIRYHCYILPEYWDYIKQILHLGDQKHQNDKMNLYANPGLPSRLLIWGIEKLASDYSLSTYGRN